MSAHELLTTRDCTAWSCTATATGEDGLCDRHRETGVVRTSGRPPTWTRELILAAVRSWAAEHGKPPSSSQWQKQHPGYPTYTACMKHFMGWRDMIEAAGLDYSFVNAQPRRAYERSPEKQGKSPPLAAVPPPAGESVPAGTTAVPERDQSLVELAQRVSDLTERRRVVLADLDALERDLRDALGACQDALQAHEIEAAA